MLTRFHIALVAAIIGFVSVDAFAQPLHSSRDGALDTVDIVYGFDVGEKVTYRVVTRDTLLLIGANTMIQAAERSYIVSYTCDSIVHDGYVLTMRFDGYAAREWRDSLPMVTRLAHPWTDRAHTFLMTPDGRRVRLLSENDTAAVAPSGPFQQMLLPYLGDRWTHVGSSKTFDIAHWLIDYVAPAILWDGTTFRAITGRLDTLGLATIGIILTDAGRATYEPTSGRSTTAIINAESQYWFSPLLGYPVGGHLVSLNRLEMRAPDGANAEGRQIVHTIFEIVAEADAALRDNASR